MKFTSVFFLAIAMMAGSAHAALRFDNNVPPTLRQQMVQDLQFMDSIRSQSATPLHQQIFGAVNGPDYINWFTRRVFTVGISDCGNPNAVACVIPTYANKIWMTKNYTQFSHPQVARLSVVYHEARHTEAQNGNWAHAKCPVPFKNAQGQDMRSIWTGALLQGQDACDVTPLGSYGSQSILLRNVAMNCSNCTDKIRADANLYALDQLQRIINPSAQAAMRKDFGLQQFRRR